ncbi:manganese ion homeostasis [Coccidioides immitis RS]|uniref:Manganese ion homeostasis n=1 Tax=Coccidioides immitis (strain RS) TaxID=246410 RepID=J3K3P8_COCIM|nr:manganese ion homeostasis [Coccidioides immitis RS]EAS28836.3 manganese ion homeostasis [Coccidioides immitis RS]
MASALGASRSHRDHFVEPPGIIERICTSLPPIARPVLATLRAKGESVAAAYTRAQRRMRYRRSGGIQAILRPLFSVRNALIALWILTLWWGERKVFRDAVGKCEWTNWEKWPEDAVPHHTVLIADPQLVDPHTYPGRPWPLSSLTTYLSDLYLYRTHSLLQEKLRPDSTFFLGDLFDGGREWGTASSSSPDDRYKKYGNDMWMKEYARFSRIFFDTFRLGGVDSAASPRGRKIIASLPGNHDLGFGNGIQLPVLERFRAYFGEGNRVDILGNHTFASVDSVSLSAMDQVDPATGGSSTSSPHSEQIWKPTEVFLNEFQTLKSRAIKEELLFLSGETEGYISPHTVVDATVPTKPTISPAASDADFPTIVLTHVPMYRKAGTPCGPLREHWPPSSTDPLPESDERNAIRIGWGYQYQNVLTPTISEDIIKKTGPVVQIYSGDDHDYCEITHREFSGAPKEITVKSASFAMGVRRPGVQLASLWNPVDPKSGKSLHPTGSQTIENHLCLFPDQLAVFIQYAYVVVFSMLILLLHAISVTLRADHIPDASDPILPLTRRFLEDIPSSSTSSTSTSTSSLSAGENRFSNRCGNGIVPRTASSSPSNDGTRPVKYLQFGGSPGVSEKLERSSRDEWDFSDKVKERSWTGFRTTVGKDIGSRGSRRSFLVFRRHFVSSLKWVAGVSFAWYFWLLWTW